MLFNADKSKCIINRPREVAHRANFVHDVTFIISGNVIENVDSWPHLGHIITENGSDELDIMRRRGNLIGQVNNVICWFNKLDCSTKTRLLKSYCSSFYGCELWNLTNLDVQTLCVAWRQALRRIWKLPYNYCHTAILERLSGPISMFDTLCKRSLNFVQKCLNSENVLVNRVSRHAVFYSRLCSGMGRNVQFYCERFGTSLQEAVTLITERKLVDDEEMAWRACIIKELVTVRDGVCCLSSGEFVRDDVCAVITHLSVD